MDINIKELEKLNKQQLLELASKLGISDVETKSKAEIREVLLKESSPDPADTSAEIETPAEETPAEETPAEETPAEETPAEETPAEETPAEETPAVSTESFKTAFELELARRQSRYGVSNSKPKKSEDAFNQELARRQSRYGVSHSSALTSKEAFNQELARRQSKFNK